MAKNERLYCEMVRSTKGSLKKGASQKKGAKYWNGAMNLKEKKGAVSIL